MFKGYGNKIIKIYFQMLINYVFVLVLLIIYEFEKETSDLEPKWFSNIHRCKFFKKDILVHHISILYAVFERLYHICNRTKIERFCLKVLMKCKTKHNPKISIKMRNEFVIFRFYYKIIIRLTNYIKYA